MTMQLPLASARAHLPAAADRATDLELGPDQHIAADHPTESGPRAVGPTPLELLTGALAACSAMSARSHLERDGSPGDIDVLVTLDAGPPTLLFRRVLLEWEVDAADAHRLVDALERTKVTMMLRPAFTIRTQIEHAGRALS